MIESVRQDILKILHKVQDIIKTKHYDKMAELSNHTIHSASIFQDEDSTSIAVVIYALSKILGSCDKKVIEEIVDRIRCMVGTLESENEKAYKECVKHMFKTISEVNSQLQKYIEEVVQYAEIRKGARIYEHGISMARAAEILGVSEWDLMGYIGKTTLIDSEEEYEKERIAFTRKLFGLKK